MCGKASNAGAAPFDGGIVTVDESSIKYALCDEERKAQFLRRASIAER
jgi:hypothetical protein